MKATGVNKEIETVAAQLRYKIVKNSSLSKTPHLGSCLSCLDILVYLYWNHLKIDPNNPKDENRDRLILSKGHAAPALFHVLAMKGFFSPKLLTDYGRDGGLFGEHPPAPKYLAGIEAATGSLGHGLPIGTGLALSAKKKKNNFSVFVVLSDGECNEGTVWEAAMFASANKLDNLTVIIDFNKWQATGRSEEILSLSPCLKSGSAFGWEIKEINGHSFTDLEKCLSSKVNEKPLAVIAHTVKGKGISFMEDDNNWHYRIPTSEEVELAKKELNI